MNQKRKVSVKQKKRIALGFLLLCLLLVGLTFRIGWHQIVRADELTEKAREQQTQDVPIAAKRGTIYDRNGKELASSITCYSVWVRPAQLLKDSDGNALPEEKVTSIAEKLAKITGQEAEEVRELITRKQALVKVAKYLDKETADQVRALKLSGVQISEDNRRYYSLGNFASQVLGSVTDDNTGRTGIELEYDQYLSGVSGRWVRNIDVAGNELVDGSEEYHEAKDGLNVVLTIDEAIQYYAEKAVAEGMEKTNASRIMCLVMDPDTGEILANVVSPGFDPNHATVPDDEAQKEEFSKLSTEEQNQYLFKLWRNPIVSDTYEPGSTFKLITVSSALEERVISTSDTFSCNTYVDVSGVKLHCWSPRDHGTQTVKEAVGNSCNPAHAKIALKMGKERFYKYLNLYGITDKTGVDYPGETSSIMYNIDDVGQVELATMGYGHSISVTPVQLLTAVNAIGNGGDLLQPHYVKALTDSEGNVVKEYDKTIVRKVLSSKTAREMRDIMEYVVSEGGGGNAKIPGYRVGGKTGTANRVDEGTGKYGQYYYASFLGMAPMDDPQVSILVVVDSPKGAFYGSQVAAPIAKSVLQDTLRYLGVEPEYTEEEQAAMEGNYTVVPDVVGKEFSEAVGIIGGKELKYSRPKDTRDDDNFIVAAQYPKAGTKVKKNAVVYIYKE
ncbi:MAG: PASTA domain-containing protein [Firmicutes bacterium]|nr:PASTA domain-containing protein [Bacillota bacterium]